MPCFFPFSSPGLENDNGYRTQELDYWIASVISFYFIFFWETDAWHFNQSIKEQTCSEFYFT